MSFCIAISAHTPRKFFSGWVRSVLVMNPAQAIDGAGFTLRLRARQRYLRAARDVAE